MNSLLSPQSLPSSAASTTTFPAVKRRTSGVLSYHFFNAPSNSTTFIHQKIGPTSSLLSTSTTTTLFQATNPSPGCCDMLLPGLPVSTLTPCNPFAYTAQVVILKDKPLPGTSSSNLVTILIASMTLSTP